MRNSSVMSSIDQITSIVPFSSFSPVKKPTVSMKNTTSDDALVVTQTEREKFASRLLEYRASIKLEASSSSSSCKKVDTTLRRSIPDWIHTEDGDSVIDPSEMEHKHHVKRGLIVKRLTASIVIRNENRRLRKTTHPTVVKKNSALYNFLTPRVINCNVMNGNDRRIESKIMTRKYLNPLVLHNNFMQRVISMDSEKVNMEYEH